MKQLDDRMMLRALGLARRAAARGEVPVGAVLCRGNRILASASNRMEKLRRVTAHAELLALEQATRRLGNWRLNGCTLYVTLEPCPMCAAALCLARVDRIIYAAADPLAGACGSTYNIPADGRLKSRPRVTSGIHAEEASSLLKSFFKKRRRGAGAV